MKKNDEDTTLLLRKISMGDNDAFRTFYNLYYLQVYRFSSYFIRSSQLVEEVVSDVFCIIWQNRKKIVKVINFEGYLYTIIRNKALFYLNQDNKLSLTEMEFIPDNLLSDIESPEYLAIDKEISTALRKAINDLPERCRLIFLMAREEGLKYKEIAQKLSISEKTVNAQMVLAIKKLSEQLSKILFFLI